MKLLAQFKKHGRYFRTPHLTLSRLVSVCRQVADARGEAFAMAGNNIDMFIRPQDRPMIVNAIVRFAKLRKSKSVALDGKSPHGLFQYDSWQVDKNLRINVVTAPGMQNLRPSLIYVLDMGDIRISNPMTEEVEARDVKRHAVFGCVKKVIAR
jgi:hypothetical protein